MRTSLACIGRTVPEQGTELNYVPAVARSRLPYKQVVAVLYVTTLFMEIMDSTIVNVAIPTLAREFGTEPAEVEWVVLGYLLSLAIFIPASGWLGDRFGTKRVYLGALALFTAASALCAMADTLGQLVAFRILQGAGGGMLTPIGSTILYRAFPQEERARASMIVVTAAVVAPATGPIVGGILIDTLSWHWIFTVNIPIGVLALATGIPLLEEYRAPEPGRFDLAGFVLSGTGLSAVLFAMSEGPNRGWGRPQIVLPLVFGVGLLGALVVVELRAREPMLALRLLGNRMFARANLAAIPIYAGFFSLIFILPIYLQRLRGFSALESGLTTFPQAIGVMICSQFVGRRLYPAIGPRRLLAAGLTGASLVGFAFLRVDLDTSIWTIRGLMLARGLFMGLAFVSIQTATYATTSLADTGRATSIFNGLRQMAAAGGVATAASLISAAAGLSGIHHAMAASAACLAAGALVSLTIVDADAAATMPRR
jgi:EmrB/QacA subfamily drug resistance transporter